MADILFLAHRLPYPPDRGDKIRSFHLLKHLCGLGRVHLACFADDETEAAQLPALRDALGGRLGEAHVAVRTTSKAAAGLRAIARGQPILLTLFDSAALRAFVANRLSSGNVDRVVAFSGQMAQFVPAGIRQTFVMDFVDMDSAKFAAYAGSASGPMRWVYRREAKRLFAFEREVAARADASLFVSEAEAALFRSRTGAVDVHAVSNGIDLQFYDPDGAFARDADVPGDLPLIVFTGQMDYPPNIDAVRFFAREVLDHVSARFAIVGRAPTPEVQALRSERVIVTGAVPDVRDWLHAADIVVAPLRIARGIQNKVLEAMAMARPVVATSAAFEGIEAQAGRDLLVADTPLAIAAAIQALLTDPAHAAQIGASGRRRMVEGYRWDARLQPIDALLGVSGARAAA